MIHTKIKEMKQKKRKNGNLIHREAVEELLIIAHEQGFKEAIWRLKNKIEERKQQIFPSKKGEMIVGGPKYEERIYLNALEWVEKILDEEEQTLNINKDKD